MRLLFVSSEFPPGPGGIGTHAYHVALHLTHMGWEVVVISAQDYASAKEIKEFNEAQPFQVVHLRQVVGAPLKALYRNSIASSWIKDWKPDCLLASGSRAIWLVAWLAQRFQLPWVAVGHGTEFGIASSWERKLIRSSFQQATAVVCVSQYTWQQMLASGIKPQMGRVIPNGADAVMFGILPSKEIEEFRAGLGLNGANLLLTVGNVTERKGQDVVIRALPLILEKAPETHYLIAGLPTKEKEFFKLAQQLGVAKNVHFLGRVDNKSLVNLLNSSNIFVMTSRHTSDGDFEGYGIAVVEAALCGKPAVVSADSGLAEAIVNGETGYGVPEGDEAATSSAILSLIEDKTLMRNMGEAARLRALREQTWELRVREYDKLLRGLIKQDTETKKLHVMHVIDSLARGGAERMLVDIANGTVNHGHAVSVCLTRSGSGASSALAEELRPEIDLWTLGRYRRFDWAAMMEFAALVKNRRVDILHSHGRSTFSFLALAKTIGLIRTPIVLHDHFGMIELDTSTPPWFRLWANRWVTHYVGVCSKLGQWGETAGIPRDRISVMNNALEFGRIQRAIPFNIRESLGIPEEIPIGIMVGGQRPEKGLDVLLESVALSEYRDSVKILVVGGARDEEYMQRCRAQSTTLGLDDTMIFLGERPDVPSLIKAVDFALLPSRSESGPLVLIEYMAGGLPFVASRVGGIGQQTADLGIPEFVPPGDPSAFARALDRMLSLSPEEMWKRGRAGQDVALDSFDIREIMPDWARVYDLAMETAR